MGGTFMKLNRNLRFFSVLKLTILFSFAWALSACSRSVPEKLELQIGVPSSKNSGANQSLGALSGTEELQFVILNLRDTPTSAPRTFMFESGRDFAKTAPGGTVVLTLNGNQIPVSATTLIQYLGGFEDSATGALRFSYGDVVVNTAVNGIINANITAATFGATNGKQLKFGGRYITSAGPSAGPTGGLITYFQPPAGKPEMAVERNEMIDGWFSAFVLEPDGNGFPKFTFKLKDLVTGVETPIWTEVNSSSPMFSGAGPGTADATIQKLSLAPHFRREYRSVGFELRADPGGFFAAGYWEPASTTIINTSIHGANLSNAMAFTIEGLSTDLEGLQPLEYSYTTPTATNLGRVAVQSDANAGASERVTFYPDRIRDNDSDMFGFSGVFKITNPEDNFEGAYLKSSYNSGMSSIDLEWNYVPLNPAFIAGAVVFHKEYTGGYGGDENEGDGGGLNQAPGCFADLVSQGYVPYVSPVTDTLNPVVASYTVTPAGTSFTNPWNHSFAICPYSVNNGVTTYFPTYARTSCIGSCYDWSEQISFGREPLSFTTYISSATQFDQSPIWGVSSRISDVTLDAGTGSYLVTNVSGLSGAGVGDEVLIAVMGSNGSGSCGQAPGDSQVNPGEFEFGKIVDFINPNNVKVVAKGSRLLKGLDFANPTNLGYGAGTAGFCYAQIVRVPHFGNMIFDNVASNITAKQFTWANDGGGIIAFRVNGAITFSSSSNYISAENTGYQGGDAGGAAFAGSSLGGLNPLTGPASGGGVGSQSGARSGGGGAGAYGDGGDSETLASTAVNSGGSAWMAGGGYSMMTMRLGSGGGGGTNGGGDGGRGGGAILIAARQINIASNGSNIINASGGYSSSNPANESGGGGGGGSINVFALKVNPGGGGANILELKATGGDGGTSTTNLDGGGGGGGHINVRTCSLAGAQTTFGGVDQLSTSQLQTPAAETVQGGAKGASTVHSQDGGMGLLDNEELHPMCDF
jgi:hypothetical protein